jgi:hypothetical protein
MNTPEHFIAEKDFAAYRPAGAFTLPEAIELVRQAIAFTREHQIPKLLINTTQLTGYGTLGTLERFQIAETWAKEASAAIIAAIVAREDQIDPHRFGLTVARNRGLHGEIFTSETDALAWLLAQRPI